MSLKNIDFKKLLNKKNLLLIIVVLLIYCITIAGSTYAYLYINSENTNTMKGNLGKVDLDLTVTKILPLTNGTDDILITNFNELAASLNDDCIDSEGDFALCQLYQIDLENNSIGVNTNLTGSVSFNNENTPNLSWILIDNYNANTNYTSASLGNTFNTATSTFTNFVENYLLNTGSEVTFYMLVWINETDTLQTDEGAYGGTIRFQDANGQGTTAEFGD